MAKEIASWFLVDVGTKQLHLPNDKAKSRAERIKLADTKWKRDTIKALSGTNSGRGNKIQICLDKGMSLKDAEHTVDLVGRF